MIYRILLGPSIRQYGWWLSLILVKTIQYVIVDLCFLSGLVGKGHITLDFNSQNSFSFNRLKSMASMGVNELRESWILRVSSDYLDDVSA